MAKGLIVSGEFGSLCAREKHGAHIELGELFIAEDETQKMLLQVFDLLYGSQLSQQQLELVSGLQLEEGPLPFMDAKQRIYVLAKLKNLVTIKGKDANSSKSLPKQFSELREVNPQDLSFLTAPKNPLKLGKLRSGSKALDFDVCIDAEKAFSHHLLIVGTTGRGKSVLMKNLLWNSVAKNTGMLVLDPHDEYYGRGGFGLKDHPAAREQVIYFTASNPPPGARTLKISIKHLKPRHFNGVVEWSEPQHEALRAYYNAKGNGWIEAILQGEQVQGNFHEQTLAVVKRRISQLLSIELENEIMSFNGIFSSNGGESTLKDITNALDSSKTVVIDTSDFAGQPELLVGSLIATEIFGKRKNLALAELNKMPVASIVLEEAPRVLGKDALEKGPNIFASIAREGRKFRLGITAITQLPSLIPKDILANLNTKIILGVELRQERQALIESASQDLSTDDRTIASLDVGEAIVSSTFLRFATPIKVPCFDEKTLAKQEVKNSQGFAGVAL